MQDRSQVFFELPLLAKLPGEDLRALAAVARLQSFRAGTVIFRQDEPGDSLHAILEGRVRIGVLSPSGAETTMAVLGPGECFGELALLDGRPRSASAVATQPTRTLMVRRPDFVAWLTERPTAGLVLLETLSLRLRSTNEALLDMFFDLPHRLVRRLLRMASADGGQAGGAAPARIAITQNGLASMLGVSRESVNKQLRALAKNGWVEISRASIVVRDFDALRRFEALV